MADLEHSFLLSGSGELIEPDDGIVAIGSGGNFALAAARALLPVPDQRAREIVQRSLEIAADICVFTNRHITDSRTAATERRESLSCFTQS